MSGSLREDDLMQNVSASSIVTRTRRKSGERGSALFEYAIVVLISLTFMFGIVDFGRALYAYHFVSNAAREGTRFASVRGATCPPTFTTACPADTTDVQNFVKNAPQGINVAAITVTPTWKNPNGLAVCGATGNKYPGCAVQVRVAYDFKFIFPLMPANFTMSSTSEMLISH
jgi:Flp pilus assembly protein TadG